MGERRELEEILHTERSELGVLREIEHELRPKFPTHFTIRSTTMTRLDPGAVPAFAATPQPTNSSLGTVIPTWSVDKDATVSVDSTGLIATVTVDPNATVGDTITLTVTATDGTTTATGTLAFVVGALPVAFPTSFTIAQLS
jgi:hypothetical protein